MTETKNVYKIKPALVDAKNMDEFYRSILKQGYQIKLWDKKNDSKIYKFFLPVIREYMFWTFNINGKEKFKAMDNEIQSAICNNYSCTIFINGEKQIICFNTGIVFIINDEKLSIQEDNIETINIDKNKTFAIESSEEYLYTYIVSLYKYVMLSKLNKEMESPDKFDKTRKAYVKFINEIYSKKVTDNIECNKLISDWEEELQLDKLYISVENKFDLLYKNNRLNNHESIMRIIIILLVVLIIIGTINLGNWMGII